MDKKNKYTSEMFSRIILMIIGLICSALGTALMIKAGLGQSTVSALARNIEYVTEIKAGTILTLINYICFILQILILRREFKILQIFQILIATVFGWIMNFFIYDFALTASINTEVYIYKMALIFLSIAITAFGVAAMIKADLIFVPFEGFCNAIVYKINKPFAKVRPFIDGLLVLIAVVLIYTFKLPNTTVREGTIIFMLIFGRVVGFYNNKVFGETGKYKNIKRKVILSTK